MLSMNKRGSTTPTPTLVPPYVTFGMCLASAIFSFACYPAESTAEAIADVLMLER